MEKAPSLLFVAVELRLRTPQAAYLERLAGATDTDESRALRRLIDRRIAQDVEPPPSSPAKKQRKHLKLGRRHVAFLDKIRDRLGLSRSDMARRIIDDAMELGEKERQATAA